MRILSTTLLISFMTVFASAANAGSDGTVERVGQQPQPRLAGCKDCLDAGYRRGFADAEAIALENTASGSSSVTTPRSFRKPVYVRAPAVQPKNSYVQLPAPVQAEPRKLPNYVQRMAPQVQPTVPNMKPKQRDVQRVQRIQQSAFHAGHDHHTQAEMIDCELTDSLNRGAGPVTTIISTHSSPVAHTKQPHRPFAHAKQPSRLAIKPAPMKRIANFKHGDHYHHTGHDRADCALVDSLNRGGSVVRVVRKY